MTEITTVSERAYAQQLLARLEGRSFPYAGQWELTCRCNLQCVMCYTDPFNTPDLIKEELRYDEIVRILTEDEIGCRPYIYNPVEGRMATVCSCKRTRAEFR